MSSLNNSLWKFYFQSEWHLQQFFLLSSSVNTRLGKMPWLQISSKCQTRRTMKRVRKFPVFHRQSERSDCVIDTYRWTLVRETEPLTRLGLPRPEGLAGCQRNSWSKKENLLLFTHPYGCFKPVCFYLFLWHIKTTSIWVWNNIMRVSKEHNFHFWKNYCFKFVCEVEADT